MSEHQKLYNYLSTLSITHLGISLAFYSFIYQFLYYQEFSINVVEFLDLNETLVTTFLTIPRVALLSGAGYFFFRQLRTTIQLGNIFLFRRRRLKGARNDRYKSVRRYDSKDFAFSRKYPAEEILGMVFFVFFISFFMFSDHKDSVPITIVVSALCLWLLDTGFNQIYFLRIRRPYLYLNYLRTCYLAIYLIIMIAVAVRIEAKLGNHFATFTDVGFVYQNTYYRTSDSGRYKYLSKTEDYILIYNRYGHFTITIPLEQVTHLTYFNVSSHWRKRASE